MADQQVLEQGQATTTELLPADEFDSLLKGAFRPRDTEQALRLAVLVDRGPRDRHVRVCPTAS